VFDDPVLPPEGSRRALPEDDDGQAPTTVDAFKPRGLTRAECEALHIVFPAQLRWSPTDRAEPMLLKQAAARLGISVSAVQDRLKSVLVRAVALGQDRIVLLTEPYFLCILARAGYLAPPTQFPHRELLTFGRGVRGVTDTDAVGGGVRPALPGRSPAARASPGLSQKASRGGSRRWSITDGGA
jgi:hypothetical protein